jgi:hypothetical protein
MFEEKNPQNPNGLEDMFAKTATPQPRPGNVPVPPPGSAPFPSTRPPLRSQLPPQPGMPSADMNMPPRPVPMSPSSGGVGRKMVTLIIVLLVLAVIGFGGWLAYEKFFAKGKGVPAVDSGNTEKTNTNTSTEGKLPVNDAPGEENRGGPTEEEPTASKTQDTDGDGLTDEEEATVKTNIKTVDTDEDGLFDYEEVKIYRTDPLNRDTDKDGYIDSAEVINGYNPLGAGRLFQVPQQ